MAIEYVHVHFDTGVTPPSKASTHGIDKSVFLDAFVGDARGRKQVYRLERDGHVVTATDLKTGITRDYPWARVREALRADDQYVNRDPRQGLKGPSVTSGKR